MAEQTSQQRYPLLYGFREVIIGKGFAAGVHFNGRVLAEQEPEGWWIYGVNPGAIAESGATVWDAVRNFRVRLNTVLFDYAAEAPNFDSFKAQVSRFFQESDSETKEEWNEARKAVRAGKVEAPDLRKVTDECPPVAMITLLKLAPNENVVEKGPAIAA